MAPHCSTCCHQSTQVLVDTPELPDAVKAHILSNDPPSDSDLPMLRDYMLSIDHYLIRLDTKIATLSDMQEELQKTLDLRKARLDLQEERRALNERRQHIYGSLSPLRRLPLEILQQIFLFDLAHYSEPDYAWFNVCDPADSLWTLRRVCRKWRMATQYPHLWVGLRITTGGLGCQSMLRDVLDRSRPLPLRIHFSWTDAPENLPLGRLLLGELVQHSERWQYAAFGCVARVFTQSLSGLRGRLPKLEELSFVQPRRLNWSDEEEDGLPFEVAPSLTKAKMTRTVFKLDGSQLKSFTSNTLTSAAFRALVSSPYLTYLADRTQYGLSRTTFPSSQSATRYLHSHLNMLLLDQCAQLNRFTLPNLQHLEAGPTYASVLYPLLPIISQFLRVSQCPLLSLTIHNCDLSIGPIPEILCIVPGLQKLSIFFNGSLTENGAVTSLNEALNVLLHHLAERASDGLSRPRLVPNLLSFVFTSDLAVPWRFMDASIIDMIRLRCDMESVSFMIHTESQLPNLSDDDVVRLRAIKNDGFNVSIVKQNIWGKDTTVIIC